MIKARNRTKGKCDGMGETDSPNGSADRLDTDQRRVGAQQLRLAARIAVQGVRLSKSPSEIVSKLRQIGLTRQEAEGIEDHARLAYQHSQMRIGTMLMVSGCIWFVGAIVVPVLRPGPNASSYSWLLLIAAVLQWLYGWQRRRYARRIRPMQVDRPPRT
jgi:hypothetical protein